MTKKTLKAVTRTQGNNRALKAGEVTAKDFAFEFEEVDPLVKAFRLMVREGAYDVSEMALTTYICARAHGAKLTGLPVFLVRDFHHKSMARSLAADIRQPKDLEGRRAGVNRGYTVTTGVWARSILADDYGVDLKTVTWVRSGDEHVAEYRPPANVEDLAGEGSLEEQVARGDLPAVIGLPANGTTTVPLVDDPDEAALQAFRSRGLYPINHLVVVRDDVLAETPDVAVQVFQAFAESKRRYVDDLKAGRISEPTRIDRVHLAVMETMEDPLPYGIAPNIDMLDLLMRHAVDQKIIDKPFEIADLFAPAVREMVG